MKFELAVICVIAVVLLICGLALIAGAWVAFWDWFDDRMQNSIRIKNEELDAAYTTGQFNVPYTMRDMK